MLGSYLIDSKRKWEVMWDTSSLRAANWPKQFYFFGFRDSWDTSVYARVQPLIVGVCVIVQDFSSLALSLCVCVFCVSVSFSPIASPPGEMSCSACRRISRWSWRLVLHGEGGHQLWWLCLGEGSFHSPGPQRWLSACCHLECEYIACRIMHFFSTENALLLLWWSACIIDGQILLIQCLAETQFVLCFMVLCEKERMKEEQIHMHYYDFIGLIPRQPILIFIQCGFSTFCDWW